MYKIRSSSLQSSLLKELTYVLFQNFHLFLQDYSTTLKKHNNLGHDRLDGKSRNSPQTATKMRRKVRSITSQEGNSKEYSRN